MILGRAIGLSPPLFLFLFCVWARVLRKNNEYVKGGLVKVFDSVWSQGFACFF